MEQASKKTKKKKATTKSDPAPTILPEAPSSTTNKPIYDVPSHKDLLPHALHKKLHSLELRITELEAVVKKLTKSA